MAAPSGNVTCGLFELTVPVIEDSALDPVLRIVTVSVPVSPLSTKPSTSHDCTLSVIVALTIASAPSETKLSTTPLLVAL